VGCGYGFFLDEAKEFFPVRTGIELSADAAVTAHNTSSAGIHVGSVYSLPPDVKDFDVIILINVIEHVYDPLPLIVWLRNRLKAGGVIVLATPDIGSYWYKIMKKRWPSFKIPEHVVFYNRRTLAALLDKAGFQSAGTIPYPHAFPIGVITEKFGINLPRALAGKIIWLPDVMIASCGRK